MSVSVSIRPVSDFTDTTQKPHLVSRYLINHHRDSRKMVYVLFNSSDDRFRFRRSVASGDDLLCISCISCISQGTDPNGNIINLSLVLASNSNPFDGTLFTFGVVDHLTRPGPPCETSVSPETHAKDLVILVEYIEGCRTARMCFISSKETCSYSCAGCQPSFCLNYCLAFLEQKGAQIFDHALHSYFDQRHVFHHCQRGFTS